MQVASAFSKVDEPINRQSGEEDDVNIGQDKEETPKNVKVPPPSYLRKYDDLNSLNSIPSEEVKQS